MPLFKEKKTTEIVTAKDIKNLTGIKAEDFSFVDVDDPEKALDELLETWIERIASHIYVRLNRKISIEDGEFLAIQDVLIRTVANLVSIAQQQRTSPVVQIGDFAINILNTSEVTKNLDAELEPFIRYKKPNRDGFVRVFSSLEDYKE